jgi:hypothetical protein
MRTTASNEASPRPLRWQAAFSTKTYTARPSPPVVWQQLSTPEAQATKWSQAVLLTWIAKDLA